MYLVMRELHLSLGLTERRGEYLADRPIQYGLAVWGVDGVGFKCLSPFGPYRSYRIYPQSLFATVVINHLVALLTTLTSPTLEVFFQILRIQFLSKRTDFSMIIYEPKATSRSDRMQFVS